VRKLTRRLGPEVVDEIIRGVIVKALEQKKFRPRALRADSTVAEADIAYPPTSGCAPMRSGAGQGGSQGRCGRPRHHEAGP